MSLGRLEIAGKSSVGGHQEGAPAMTREAGGPRGAAPTGTFRVRTCSGRAGGHLQDLAESQVGTALARGALRPLQRTNATAAEMMS